MMRIVELIFMFRPFVFENQFISGFCSASCLEMLFVDSKSISLLVFALLPKALHILQDLRESQPDGFILTFRKRFVLTNL